MKKRLHLSIDKALLAESKKYARQHGISLSALVEAYFIQEIKTQTKRSYLDVVADLNKPTMGDVDIREEYYKGRSGKYNDLKDTI